MAKDEAKVFKFKIPLQADRNQSVIIKASPFRGNVHDFTLLAMINPGTGNPSMPSTDFGSRKGISAWKKGQVIRLNPDEVRNWCAGCEIQILLDVVDSGYYHIVAQTNDAIPLIQNG
jgi:hypothetical protein